MTRATARLPCRCSNPPKYCVRVLRTASCPATLAGPIAVRSTQFGGMLPGLLSSFAVQEIPMDFGLFTMFSTREGASQFHTFQEWFKLAQVAEDLGLDTLWLGESHFRPQRAVLASPLVAASAVAARTKRIRVGLAVQVLPLANPLRVAEEAAIVDHISEGRLIFGVGR